MCILYLLSCRSVADFPNKNIVIRWGGSSTSTSNYIYMDMSALDVYAQMRFVRVFRVCALNITTPDAVRLHLQRSTTVLFIAPRCFFCFILVCRSACSLYFTYEHMHWRSLKYRTNLLLSLSLLRAPKKSLLCSVNLTEEGPSMLLSQWNLTWFWRTDFSIMHTQTACYFYWIFIYAYSFWLSKLW